MAQCGPLQGRFWRGFSGPAHARLWDLTVSRRRCGGPEAYRWPMRFMASTAGLSVIESPRLHGAAVVLRAHRRGKETPRCVVAPEACWCRTTSLRTSLVSWANPSVLLCNVCSLTSNAAARPARAPTGWHTPRCCSWSSRSAAGCRLVCGSWTYPRRLTASCGSWSLGWGEVRSVRVRSYANSTCRRMSTSIYSNLSRPLARWLRRWMFLIPSKRWWPACTRTRGLFWTRRRKDHQNAVGR